MSKSSKKPKTSNSSKSPDTEGAGAEGFLDLEGGITVGAEIKGAGLSITIEGDGDVVAGIGIGVMSVDYNLSNPYESTTGYFGDLFEFTGEREGCRVRIDKYIGGIYVTSEYQTIPECEDEDQGKGSEPPPEVPEPKTDWDEANPGWKDAKPGDEGGFKSPPSGIPGSGAGFLVVGVSAGGFSVHFGVQATSLREKHCTRARREGFLFYVSYGGFQYGSVYNPTPDLNGIHTHSGFTADYTADYTTNALRYKWFRRSIPGGGGEHFVLVAVEASNNPPIGLLKGEYSKISEYYNYLKPTWNSATSYPPHGSSVNYAYVTGVVPEIVYDNFSPSRYLPKPPPPLTLKPMDCCDDLSELIRGIYEVLAVEEILDKGVIVPAYLTLPGVDSKKVLIFKDYLALHAYQIRVADHLGVHPISVKLDDINAAKSGNQGVELEFPNGSAAIKQILELLLENKGDQASRLNLQIRIAITTAQILNVVSKIYRSVKAVIDFLGMPMKERKGNILMPFDVSLGASSKGFDPKKLQKQLDENAEKPTEETLPKFMNDANQPYIYDEFNKTYPTLIELLKNVGGFK